ARRVFHRRDNREISVAHRNDNSEAAKLAFRVVLHSLEVARLHELTVRIEAGEHSAECRVSEVMIVDLFLVNIVLPNELQRASEDRNACVTDVVLRLGGERVIDAHSEKKECE